MVFSHLKSLHLLLEIQCEGCELLEFSDICIQLFNTASANYVVSVDK